MQSGIQGQRSRWRNERVFMQQHSRDTPEDEKLAMAHYQGQLEPFRKLAADVADAEMPALQMCLIHRVIAA